MGVSYTRTDHRWVAIQRVVTLEAAFDDSYTPGGEDLSAADAGLGKIEHVTILTNVTDAGHVATHDAGKLQLFGNDDGAEASGTAADGDTVLVEIRGRS